MEMPILSNQKMDLYFEKLIEGVRKEYAVAELARAKGLDPVDKVEIPLAMSLAEKCVGLISSIYPQLNNKITERILELEKVYGALDVAVSFKIAEEIAKENFCKFKDRMEAIDAAIRVGFAYNTLGVVSSPIEGFTGIELGKTKEGKEYFIANFSGPIRSAGTTASCVVLMLIDYLREIFGYAKYDADEKEMKRYVTENYDYHERVNNLQYLPTEEEILFLAKNIPIQISGDPTEKLEVSNYKDLPRIHSNQIRGGMCLIFSEGLAQKAQKGLRLWRATQAKGFVMTGWEFLDEYILIHKKREKGTVDASPTYIKDLVAGRPVFGHPSMSGGFRFRYGRSRVSGFSATSVHPATMAMSDNFLSGGVQLKIEKPTKGCVITGCDSIDGPIVKLKDGSVKKPWSYEEARKMYKDVEEIVYFGDILFPLGDVINRNYELVKPGFVEEWWNLLVEKEMKLGGVVDVLFSSKISLDNALEISKKYNVPLYPGFIFYWTQITREQLFGLLEYLKFGVVRAGKIVLPYEKSVQEKFVLGKRALELLGVCHDVVFDNVVIDKEASALLINLGISQVDEGESLKDKIISVEEKIKNSEGSVLDLINLVSEVKIKDKAGSFIGSRMGRPEKAKLRKLTGSPNGLFSVGNQGGRLRSVQESLKNGTIESEFPIYFCAGCNKETIYKSCESCGSLCFQKFYCRECGVLDQKCEHERCFGFNKRTIDSNYYTARALESLGFEKTAMPELVKGVRGTTSESHDIENLAKGILRAKHNLTVNKDGTIRYDGTELPVTHFKVKEIGGSVEKLRELGYEFDIYGNSLENEEQILEIKPHDVILPSCPETADEKADEVFFNLANFIDDELENFYKLPRYYNLKKKEDLIGMLVVCMAPHNCAGVVGRIIGFSHLQGLMASPYIHAAVRRDCVYPTTKFTYIENEKINYREIGSFVEGLIKNGSKISPLDNFGTIKIENNKELYALGVDTKTKELKKKKIKYFIKAQNPEKWIKIKTSTGREQVMTPRHTLIYLDEQNQFCSKTAQEAKVGDKIAILKNLNLFKGLDKINLIEEIVKNVPEDRLNEVRVVGAEAFFKNLIEKIGKNKMRMLLEMNNSFRWLGEWYRDVPLNHIKKLVENDFMKLEDIPLGAKLRTIFNDKKWDFELKITPELMRVLGYYTSEGYSRQTKSVSQVGFRIMRKDMQDDLLKSISSAFGLVGSCGEDNTKITICNKLVYYLFRYCFKTGEGAYKKEVPEFIYSVSDELIKDYLSAYFDGDGTVINLKDGGHRKCFQFYSVNKKLLDGMALLFCRFGVFGRFSKTNERLPGRKVLERYKELNKDPKKHILYHLVYSGKDFYELAKILNPVNKRKQDIIKNIDFKIARDRRALVGRRLFDLKDEGDIFIDFIKEVSEFKDNENSYCFEIEHEDEEDKNVLWAEQIINARCDGDEMAVMLLMDVLINFSRKFLPAHRGGTQDAPLVLNSRIRAGEVDDQILDFEVCSSYPLELYELAEQGKHSSEVKIETVKRRLKRGEDAFTNIGFTHNTSNFNDGVVNSSYKSLPSMKEKVGKQMELVRKLRSVDAADVARLIIERHFIRDIRGNLRKFSTQEFRCVSCNEKYRRPPMIGVCTKCNGKLLFTISEGSIIKYLESALELANNFNVPPYTKQGLELAKIYIQSIFGKKEESLQLKLGDIK